jgi:tetraacyldisaccharide 4'-kinase
LSARLFERLWWRERGDEPLLQRVLLWPLSLCALGYAAGARLAARRPRVRAGVPVISVGNLVVGGAGKTPVALLLCEELRRRGRRVALLSRGYGGSSRAGVAWVCRGEGPLLGAAEAGDEPVLLARRAPWLPVLVGRDRALLADAAVAAGAEVLVLDDGLQHHRLQRDLDVLVVDARNPLGNGRLLPRGPLREGPAALARLGGRGLLWLTGGGGTDSAALPGLLAAAAAAGLRGPVRSEAAPRPAPELRGARVFLLAGIARPGRFEASVAALGAEVCGRAFFPDHHRFSAAELRAVQERAAALGARLVTTEKDAARLPAGFPALALPLELRLLSGAAELAAALAPLLVRP